MPHVERRLLEVVGRLLRQCVLQFHSSKIATITTTRLSTLSTTLRFNQFFVRFVHICVVILSCGGILSYYMSTFNKSSAVAEMGDRLATVDMRRKVEAYLHAKYYLDPSSRLATINVGRFFGGGSAPFGRGERGPRLTPVSYTHLTLPTIYSV